MSIEEPKKLKVEQWLNTVDYSGTKHYVPSEFSLNFINFIKLVNGEEGEESPTPVMHMKMLDQLASNKADVANLCYRGSSKTTIMAEYLFLYIAVYGEIEGFGSITIAIYVSDSIENGVKNMRKNLEFRRESSEFLMKYIPKAKFTDIRYEFENLEGKKLIVKAYGAKTGVRGAKEQGRRVDLAVLDDLISDDDARSLTVIASIEDTVYSAIDYALHPSKSKTIWSGTPFNSNDPLYKAIESGAWYVNVFPVCEVFPCKKEDFKGAWEERHTYEYVEAKYKKAKRAGKLASFNQELMLRIMSDEERLIRDSDITWYKHSLVKQNISKFNIYITTDFATSDKHKADFSTINVWAYSNNGDWLWVDGFCKRALMNESIDNLFRLAQKYKPQQVGVEVNGQQGGFIAWIKGEMIQRNVFFSLATGHNSGSEGIRSVSNKLSKFVQMAVPLFKTGKIWFPEELRDSEELAEMLNELSLVTINAIKSKHDDQLDNVSMLSEFNAWKPSEESVVLDKENNSYSLWEDDELLNNNEKQSSYFV